MTLDNTLTRSIAQTKRRLVKGGLLQPVEWGTVVPVVPPDRPDPRGRKTYAWSDLDALIEERPGLDRKRVSTERADDTVLTILDPRGDYRLGFVSVGRSGSRLQGVEDRRRHQRRNDRRPVRLRSHSYPLVLVVLAPQLCLLVPCLTACAGHQVLAVGLPPGIKRIARVSDEVSTRVVSSPSGCHPLVEHVGLGVAAPVGQEHVVDSDIDGGDLVREVTPDTLNKTPHPEEHADPREDRGDGVWSHADSIATV